MPPLTGTLFTEQPPPDACAARTGNGTSIGTPGQLELNWKIRRDLRPAAGPTADPDRAAQSLDAVGETNQAGSARRIAPADAVVANRQQQAAVACRERNLDVRCLRVLRRVGQGLGCDVVRRDLDRLRE